MDGPIRQGILKYVAAISAATTCGLADAAPQLAQIPAEIVAEVVDEAETPRWRTGDRARLLRLLAADPRVVVRSRVAESLGSLFSESPDETERLARDLVRDSSAHVRFAAAKGLATMLDRSTLADRAQVVATWTLSAHVDERVAIARALCHRTPVLITDLAIDQLASDPSAAVRRSALQAAARHFSENPPEYRRIASKLVADPDRHVRRSARRLFNRTA